MDKYVALLGSLSLIFSTLVAVTLLVDFIVKGYCVFAIREARKEFDTEKKNKAPSWAIVDLFLECEEQKVWLCAIWQRPVATLLALGAAATCIRFSMGMSLTFGIATLVFVVGAFGIPSQFSAFATVIHRVLPFLSPKSGTAQPQKATTGP